jgi:hypothetical protein
MGVRPPNQTELADKQAITEILYRYSRGLDRMDRALTLGCWHPGGTDNHAPLYSGSAEGFIDWLWPVHAAMLVTRHVVTNILIELKGDRAGSECYYTLALRIPKDGRIVDRLSGGRYIDQFEKIDGMWAIRHRDSIRDWMRIDEYVPESAASTPLIKPNNPEIRETLGARDPADLSYRAIGGLI